MRRNVAAPPWLPRGRPAVVAAATAVAAVVVGWIGTVSPGDRRPTVIETVAPNSGPIIAKKLPLEPDVSAPGETNVLYGDGELPWPNPFMGTQRHNIFTGRVPSATDPEITARSPFASTAPRDDTGDSILLPAAN